MPSDVLPMTTEAVSRGVPGAAGVQRETASARECAASSIQEQSAAFPRNSLPKYVRACQGKAWSLALWEKSKTREKRFVCFECRSWRCTARCKRLDGTLQQGERCDCCSCRNAAQWFGRIKSAFDRLPEHWNFLTLTFDQKRFVRQHVKRCKGCASMLSQEAAPVGDRKALLQKKLRGDFQRAPVTAWPQKIRECAERAAFKRVYRVWQLLYKRITRKLKEFRWDGRRWVKRPKGDRDREKVLVIAAIEQHSKGWPHLHVALRHAVLHSYCTGESARVLWVRWLKNEAMRCGFGFKGSISAARNRDAIAGYVVKVSAIPGELSKGVQVPVRAPKGFRRIRASHGLLPPKTKNENVTGALFQEKARDLERVYAEALKAKPLPVREEFAFDADATTGEVTGEFLQARTGFRKENACTGGDRARDTECGALGSVAAPSVLSVVASSINENNTC